VSARNLEALLRPRRVVVLGDPVGATAQSLCRNLRRELPESPTIWSGEALEEGASPVLVIVGDAVLATVEQFDRLGERGCRALVWPHADAPDTALLAAAAKHGMRLLGARSPGLIHPTLNLNAAALPSGIPAGALALIVQSHSVAAAAVDWAAGRQIGFSWAAVTGIESDVDVADLLDFAAFDGETRAVVLQIGHVRNGRKFMSAARACARIKPVAVLQTQPGDDLPAGRDRVRSAAFARAGLIECRSLPELFDAITALERLPAQPQTRVLVVANGAGICALGVNAMLREHLTMAHITPDTWLRVRNALPGARWLADAVDLGDASVETTAAALAAMLEDDNVDLLLFVRSPIGDSAHEAYVEALETALHREKLLTVWLGLQSALPARRRCAEARIATFTSPDAAARAARHRRDYARNRELLTQTPPRDPALEVDGAATAIRLQKLIDNGIFHGGFDRVIDLLNGYRVDSVWRARDDSVQIDVQFRRHPEFGIYLGVAMVGAPPSGARGLGFPPLDPLLAGRILAEAGVPGASAIHVAPKTVAGPFG